MQFGLIGRRQLGKNSCIGFFAVTRKGGGYFFLFGFAGQIRHRNVEGVSYFFYSVVRRFAFPPPSDDSVPETKALL